MEGSIFLSQEYQRAYNQITLKPVPELEMGKDDNYTSFGDPL